MKEYIEREAAISLARTTPADWENETSVPVRALKNIPAADVVEVVRCRDCDIGTCYSDDSVQCEWSNGFYADDFCPRGKRKKEGTSDDNNL